MVRETVLTCIRRSLTVQRAGFPADSLFFGTELPVHVKASWGGFDLVDATKALLRAALANERNKKLMLVSESCIPLYPPTLIYQELMSEPKSRINACPHRVRLQVNSNRVHYVPKSLKQIGIPDNVLPRHPISPHGAAQDGRCCKDL